MYIFNHESQMEIEVLACQGIKQKKYNPAKEWCITLLDGTILRSTNDARFFDQQGGEWQEAYEKVNDWAEWTKIFFKL